MADQKISALTEDTTPDPTDVVWAQTAAGDADKRIPISALATQAELDAEATTRGNADTALDTRLDAIEAISIATDAELAAAVAAEAVLARNADNLTSGTVADARIASTIARDSEVTTAISNHEAAADPHTGYLKEADASGTYVPLPAGGASVGDILRVVDDSPLTLEWVTVDEDVAGDIYAAAQPINAQTGTSYGIVAADVGKLVTLSNGSAIAVTVPQDSDQTIAVGCYVDLMALGAGQVTVSAGTGATLRISGLTGKSRAQYSRLVVQKVSANTWSLAGDLAAS